jgi:hypothetical protein
MAQETLGKNSRYLYWDTLHFIANRQKDKRWMAECILFAKHNSSFLVDPVEAEKKRKINIGKLDADAYKKIIDPVMPDGSGGTAEYFAADFEKANPIFVHLDNILEARMEKIPLSIYVKAADEKSKHKMQKENDKILTKKYFTMFVNEMNAKIGIPQLGKGQDPYKYVNQMKGGGKGNMPITMLDSIKYAINDNEDLALFNEYIYKDGVEIAMELGIDYYMNQNSYPRIYEKGVIDIKNFNVGLCRYYTSKTTGRPVIEYLDPATVRTSPFSKKDLSDIVYWFIEYDVTFGDFVRMFGAKIKEDCEATNQQYDEVLKDIFDMNRMHNGVLGLRWDTASNSERSNSKIRIGYIETETQDMEVYSDREVRGNSRYRKEAIDYKVSKDSRKRYGTKREESYYNCWYRAYYIPLNSGANAVQTSDFDLQAKYVFDFGKVQDQQREGDDYRYSKCTLVGWKSDRMSFLDIMDSYLPKINLLWFHFQNNIANAMPHGATFADEMINLMMQATDDANKNGKDGKFETLRRLKQTGYAISKMFNDDGKLINDGKPFVEVKTGHLASAAENLMLMQQLYNMTTQSLAMSDISEGLSPKPRVSLGALQLSNNASYNGSFFVEKGCTALTVGVQERLMYYIKEIIDEGDFRAEDFTNIVGLANSLAMESVKDIPLHELALLTYSIPTDEEKQRVVMLAEKLASAGLLDPNDVLFISRIDNLKYAEAIMRIRYKSKLREQQEREAMQHQYKMEEKNADLQIELAKIDKKNEGMLEVQQLIKGFDVRIQQLILQAKDVTQSRHIEQRGNNKEHETILKHELDKKKEGEKSLA